MKEVNDKGIIEEIKRLSEIQKSPLITALDGRSGTGKSILSKIWQKNSATIYRVILKFILLNRKS